MFTILRRTRRPVAVLAAVALLASMLAAVPAVADEHPEADYTATFSACDDAPASSFEDVPSGHANAGDIDCIAYYGITQGTSATTYSPLMSVSREHMALFLTRLAGIVGIEVTSTPADAGFTDIGDLSAASQTAINQLADLGITQGTSATTYSPGDSVTRGQMALFISRLMNQMDPMAEDAETVFGYTPEKVVNVVDDTTTEDNDETITVGSPFTDLGTATKTTYDAITALWELGVASGISATAYGPSALITRAAMADFMAGVLDHSNARPAGVSIQAAETWDFGDFDTTIAVSYRDDSFAPMIDVSIKTFASADVGEFNEDGGCSDAAECAWTDDESLTDGAGNVFLEGSVDDGKMNTYYAWMGDSSKDENDFDVDTSPHSTVTMSSTTDAVNLKVTTDINENSTAGNTVDIDVTRSVTLTVQLVDGDGAAVAKPDVEITIAVQQGTNTLHPAPAAMKTDDDGQVTYTTGGPKSTKGDEDPDRTDIVTFSSDVNDDGTTGEVAGTAGDPAETVASTFVWTDSDPTLVTAEEITLPDDGGTIRGATGKGVGSTHPYALLSGQDRVTIRATVSFYDQYGNSAGKGENVQIDIGEAEAVTRTVSSRGMASWRVTNDGTLNTSQTVTYVLRNADDDAGLEGAPTVASTTVLPVRHADDDSSAAAADIAAVYAKEDRFRIGGALYSYDSDDVFINDVPATDGGTPLGEKVDMARFETLIGGNLEAIGTAANIQIVLYDDDGSSIFRVVRAATSS